jgi:hypothetical protein
LLEPKAQVVEIRQGFPDHGRVQVFQEMGETGKAPGSLECLLRLIDHIQGFGTLHKGENTVIVPFALKVGTPIHGCYGANEKVIGMTPGQVLANGFQVMGNVFRTFEHLVIYLLKDIFDIPLVVLEDPGGIYQTSTERDAMPVQRV